MTARFVRTDCRAQRLRPGRADGVRATIAEPLAVGPIAPVAASAAAIVQVSA